MLEINGNLWDYHTKGEWIVITTNGFVKKNGAAVLGAGIAKQATLRYPLLEMELGQRIRSGGNNVNVFSQYRLITLPVKHKWIEPANTDLIRRSIGQLQSVVINLNLKKIYLPRPGCGNGRLDWEMDVKPLLINLSDKFVIVDVVFEPPLRRYKGFQFIEEPEEPEVKEENGEDIQTGSGTVEGFIEPI